jgi:hypothetical protein
MVQVFCSQRLLPLSHSLLFLSFVIPKLIGLLFLSTFAKNKPVFLMGKNPPYPPFELFRKGAKKDFSFSFPKKQQNIIFHCTLIDMLKTAFGRGFI